MWDKLIPEQLSFFIPILLNFSIDEDTALKNYIKRKRVIDIAIEELNINSDQKYWHCKKKLSNNIDFIGHKNGSAPSQLDVYFLGLIINKLSTEERKKFNFPYEGIQIEKIYLKIQSFGVGIIDIRYKINIPPTIEKEIDYINSINNFINKKSFDILEFIEEYIITLKKVFMKYNIIKTNKIIISNNFHNTLINSEAKIFWVHTFTNFINIDHSNKSYDVWKNNVKNNKVPKRLNHPIDSIINHKTASIINLSTRRFDLDLIVGWGHSLSVRNKSTLNLMNEDLNTHDIFQLAQVYSAFIFIINKLVLLEIQKLIAANKQMSFVHIKNKSKSIIEYYENTLFIIGLIKEQEYCLSAVEQNQFIMMLNEWKSYKLLDNTLNNLDHLNKLVNRLYKEKTNESRKKLNISLFLITIFTSSVVLFSILPNVLLEVEPSRNILIGQIFSITVIILVALFILKWKD